MTASFRALNLRFSTAGTPVSGFRSACLSLLLGNVALICVQKLLGTIPEEDRTKAGRVLLITYQGRHCASSFPPELPSVLDRPVGNTESHSLNGCDRETTCWAEHRGKFWLHSWRVFPAFYVTRGEHSIFNPGRPTSTRNLREHAVLKKPTQTKALEKNHPVGIILNSSRIHRGQRSNTHRTGTWLLDILRSTSDEAGDEWRGSYVRTPAHDIPM